MADVADQRRTFYEFVVARGGRARLLGCAEEADLVSKAVFELGLPAFEAKGLLLSGASTLGAPIESALDRTVETLVAASADARKRLPRPRFEQVVRYARALANDGLSEAAAERKVKEAASRLGVRPRPQGPLRSVRWYRRAGRGADAPAGASTA
jgi:hypothetical protein